MIEKPDVVKESLEHSLKVTEQSLSSVESRIEDHLKMISRDYPTRERLKEKKAELEKALKNWDAKA